MALVFPPNRQGWLLDATPISRGMLLWMMLEQGEHIFFPVPFRPRFYASGPEMALERIKQRLRQRNFQLALAHTERIELFSGAPYPVLEISVFSPADFFDVVRTVALVKDIALYNADIPLPQLYFYESGLFPLALCRTTHIPGRIDLLDSPWATDTPLPPFRILSIELEPEIPAAREGALGALSIEIDGERRVLDGEDPREFLMTFNAVLTRNDPDIILSNRGDDLIFPRLLALSSRLGIPLLLNRTKGKALSSGRDRSFFSYGRTIFRAGSVSLFGRWHLDRKNSFILGEAGLSGLFEQSRVTRIPVQHLARTSTGTGITSMQMAYAVSAGILVPLEKSSAESFRSSLDLIKSDKGGMVFLPRPGFHESVAELDFASMYPSLMATFNISPETVNCLCCTTNRIPNSTHHLCTRRKGLVPTVLESLLAKRRLYKELKNTTDDPDLKGEYDRRQGALKWLLVVSFGYLGYKNARFGRVEAHECVTALSREKLLQAKEIAENRGYRLLHGIVDSLWLSRPGIDEADCRRLAEEITQETGIPIALEGLYRWIIFFSSTKRERLAVPNRYFGVFRSGERKVRGIEVRRSDTPLFISDTQEKLLDHLAYAHTLQEYRTRIPAARQLLEEAVQEIRQGRVPVARLVIRKRLSKSPESYEKRSFQAIVAQELAARGRSPQPGERVAYVITAADDPDPASRARAYDTFSPDYTYDRNAYERLLLRACEPLLDLPGMPLRAKAPPSRKPLEALLWKR